MAFGGRTPITPTLQMRKLRPREVRWPAMFIGLIGQGQDLNSGCTQEGEKEGSQPAWVCMGSGRPGKGRHREGLWEGSDVQERRKAISCGENA